MLAKLYASIQPELDSARAAIERELEHCDPRLREVCEHAFSSSGKAIRPALLLFCGRACGPLGQRHVTAAAAIELIHGATLVHDDVIDEATERRRQSSVNARWGSDVSILLGDLLFARALSALSGIATPAQLRLVAVAVGEVCEGELLQLLAARGEPLDERGYAEVIGKKTGALCGAACALGAALAEAPPERIARFDAFGRSLGIAFQIVDDCLDIRGDERIVGKTLGTDLLGGRATLPVIYARGHATSEAMHQFDQLLKHPESPRQRVRLAAILRDCGAFDYCEHRASEFIQGAIGELDFLEDGPARQSLAALADFVVQREV